MKLLTNGAVMVMIVGDRPYTEPVPLYLNQVSEEMDWEKQNPKITSLSQIKAKWPYLFDKKNLMYIPKLKFVEPDLRIYNLDVINYSNDKTRGRPHFLDKVKELNGSKPTDSEFERFLEQLKRIEC